MKLTIIAILVFSLHAAFAQDHNHHAGHSAAKATKHADGKKFTATKDLKVRMEKISTLMKELNGKKDNQKEVQDYGNKISAVVSDIFNTCKLPEEADAAVHPVLGKVLEGSEELKQGKFEDGSSKINAALTDYQKLFSHKLKN